MERVCYILIYLMLLFSISCSNVNSKEADTIGETKIKVTLVFCDKESISFEVDTNSIISLDMLPINEKEYIQDLYYDSEYNDKYKGETLNEDTNFYVKYIDNYVLSDNRKIASEIIKYNFNWIIEETYLNFPNKANLIKSNDFTYYRFIRKDYYYIVAYYNYEDYNFVTHEKINNIIWRKYQDGNEYVDELNGKEVLGVFCVENGLLIEDLLSNEKMNSEFKIITTLYENTPYGFCNNDFNSYENIVVLNNSIELLNNKKLSLKTNCLFITNHSLSNINLISEIYEENNNLYIKYKVSGLNETNIDELLKIEFGDFYQYFNNIIYKINYDESCVSFLLEDYCDFMKM